MIRKYQTLIKVFFGTNLQHFTQVKNITQTVKSMFCRKNIIIIEIQRENLIWEIHWDARALFGNISTAEDLHNNTGPKSPFESIHAFDRCQHHFGNAVRDIPDLVVNSTYIRSSRSRSSRRKVPQHQGKRKIIIHVHETISSST